MPEITVYPPTPPILKAAMKFLDSYFFDEDWDSAKNLLASQVAWETDRGVLTSRTGASAGSVLPGLSAIEDLLADPDTEPYVLTWLAEVNTGWGLDHPREEKARERLQQIVAMTREILADQGNAR